MAQRRHHYERAFEEFLRSRRIPYVAVDEARKALLPEGLSSPLRITHTDDDGEHPAALKSFDFVIYGAGESSGNNLLIDIKGRRCSSARRNTTTGHGRLESWVTQDDVDSLSDWERLFGAGFQAAFVFVYWCDAQPPDALFQEVVEFRGVWYALRAVTLTNYRTAMKVRSARWRTVDLPTAAFERLSQPFAPPGKPRATRSEDLFDLDQGPDLAALVPLEGATAGGRGRG